MALTELQIRRYARHILLPEVGGRGQERLLAASVRIRGEAAMADLARAYLEAAGVPCQVETAKGLALIVAAPGHMPVEIHLGSDAEAWFIAVGEVAPLTAQPPIELALLAASLAASEALRIILGIGSPQRRWQISGPDPRVVGARVR